MLKPSGRFKWSGQRPVAGLCCLLLQITVIGWIPAAVWAVYALSQFATDRKIRQMISQS